MALYFISREPKGSKWFAFFSLSVSLISLAVEKWVLRWYFSTRSAKNGNSPLIVVGAGELGMEFYNSILSKEDHGHKFIGFVDDGPHAHLNGHYLGNISHLGEVLEKHSEVEDIVVALPGKETDTIRSVVSISEKHAKRVRIMPDYFPLTKTASFSFIGSIPLISLRSVRLDEPDSRLAKRVFDIVFSFLVLLLVFSWLVPIIALLIKITSKGPVFFKQKRWGLHKTPITCYKFRTMVQESRDVDVNGKYQQAKKDDPRITKIGKFLRKTSLDELPQFINVLQGSMSVVGPRPHPIPLNNESKDKIADYMLRHMVKPGITGWAQVHGYRGETKDLIQMQSRINRDIWYIENWNFWLDIQIIFQTIINAFKGEINAY